MSKSDKAQALQHRLAAKLRENLRRRKEPPKDAGAAAAESGQLRGERKDDGKP